MDKNKEKIFEYNISHFDFVLIYHVKKLRKKFKLSKKELSKKINRASTFVGNVESHSSKQKYSTSQISLLAKAFGFKNIGEFLNFPTPIFENIKVKVKFIYNEASTKVIKSIVLKIEEDKEYRKSK